MLKVAYWEHVMSRGRCFEAIEDDPRSGRQLTSTGDVHADQVKVVVRTSRR